jgi:hypothetical protein
MVDEFCSGCGKRIRGDDKFCPGCGKPIVSASTPSTPYDASWLERGESSTQYTGSQQRSTSSYAPSETEWRLRVGLSLGLIGGVFGILVGVFFLWGAFNGAGLENYLRGVGAILFAILGIVGGSGIIANKVHCGLLMLIGGVGMILTLAWLGALSAILFFLGGVLILYGSSWMQGR